jgi:hypothetical protein
MKMIGRGSAIDAYRYGSVIAIYGKLGRRIDEKVVKIVG